LAVVGTRASPFSPPCDCTASSSNCDRTASSSNWCGDACVCGHIACMPYAMVRRVLCGVGCGLHPASRALHHASFSLHGALPAQAWCASAPSSPIGRATSWRYSYTYRCITPAAAADLLRQGLRLRIGQRRACFASVARVCETHGAEGCN
jgi:hypothetical protein